MNHIPMPSNQQVSAEILGQIALIQSMVSHLPHQESVMKFVRRGLEGIPGITDVAYSILNQAVAEKEYDTSFQNLKRRFPLKFNGMVFGDICFNIAAPHLFDPYVPYLENLGHMLGVVFEERRQRQLNEAHRSELEQRVFERTQQLEKEISEHQRSQKFLDSIINNTRNVIYVKDFEGRFTLVNHQFCRIFNLRQEQVIGHRPADIFSEEIAEQHLQNDKRVLAQKEPITFTEHADLSDGRHEYLSIKYPIFNDAGEVYAVGGISTDITEIKKVENELRLDEARLEALLTLSQMTDADIQAISDYALKEAIRLTKSKIGYLAFTTPDESEITLFSLEGEALNFCAFEEGRSNYKMTEMGLCGEAVRQRKPVVINEKSALDETSPLSHSLTSLVRHLSVPIFEGRRIVAVAGVGNKPQDYDEADVRQLKLLMQGMWRMIQRMRAEEEKNELEKRLRQAYKMESIGTLAGGIAHDFNNILSAIFGYTELSLGETEPGSFLDSNLKNVLSAARRAKELVAHILAFSRQSEQELMPIQLKPIVKEVLKFIRASLPATIEIRQNIKGDPNILADPTQIHQVLMNLCTNAGQAMSGGTGILEVTLETMELDEAFTSRHPGLNAGVHVKLAVSDTGHGIPSEIMDRIFDPFFTTKERGQGTGMGLAVVHGIVKTFGGQITVYSDRTKGTVFNVFLPAIEQRAAEKARPSRKPEGGNERILFVDDEKTLVDLGVTMLGSLGYDVTGETSSPTALEIFSRTPDDFDLVITDLTMPQMTGDRLAREMMEIKPDIPIILCTGFSASVNEESAMAMGIRAFVKKPILNHQIAEIIRKTLDRPTPQG